METLRWMRPSFHFAKGVLCVTLVFPLAAQMPGVPPTTPSDSEVDTLRTVAPELAGKQPMFADLDLLRRDEFAHAGSGAVSVRVQDRSGNFIAGLRLSDFSLVVNGTTRQARLRAPGPAALIAHQPVVLLVFPPNQPAVHWIAARDAIRYFGTQPEAMPWKVGIFDANGTFLPFTGTRSELLRNLAAVQAAKEPMQFTGYRFLPYGESSWRQKAEDAIANMTRSDGPRLIIAVNPLSDRLYGLNEASAEAPIVRESPRQLVEVASRVGAHIYIDNAGGPEAVVPFGSAADMAAIRNRPLQGAQMVWQQGAALHNFAYTSSQMMVAARDTMGGYANTLKDLGPKIERDLREVYVLEFDLTAQDQDRGVPEVEVSSSHRDLRLAMMDLAPLRLSTPVDETLSSRKELASEVLATMRKNMSPVQSPNFRIYQHVDYFPLRGGVTPVLPMSGIVVWTGPGSRPTTVTVAESVIDMDLSTPALEREFDASWQARRVRWERDGELHSGHYVWLVAVHDADGTILASAKQSFTVPQPRDASLMMSSMVIGSVCRAGAPESGLQRRPPPGTRGIVVPLIADPLRLPDCRLVPEPVGSFTVAEMLRALVRMYPSGKLGKQAPEEWSARFTLRGAGGIEAVQEARFAVDAGSGLAARAAMALDGPGVQQGPHVLELTVTGPGIRGALKEERKVLISAPSVAAQRAAKDEKDQR